MTPLTEVGETVTYEALYEQGQLAFQQGNVEHAYEVLDQALELARRAGDRVLIDRAICNRAAVAIVLGSTVEVISELRGVLNHHTDPIASRLASYNLSLAYEQKKDFKKGAFYARIAHNLSCELDRADWKASSLNQLGNCQLGDCLFEDAGSNFAQALALLPPEATISRLGILGNLGYCHVLQGRKQEGLRLLYESLRGLRRAQGFESLMIAHLDLSYALLEIDRPSHALKHAQKGLELADLHGYPDVKRNALYLVGQAFQQSGSAERAAGTFQRLQTEFFPASPEVSRFLMAVDVRPMINLRA